MNLHIIKYCQIKDYTVKVSGKTVYKTEGDIQYNNFIKSAFKSTGIKYPKFYKMDDLCKLGFLASGLLLEDNPILDMVNTENFGIVLQNSSSSLDTDFKYQNTIQDRKNYFPSPSVFVYTLPNIIMGEICIKYKITGENNFFIFEQFNPWFLHSYILKLFEEKQTEACLTGWVEFFRGKYETFLFLVTSEDFIPVTRENIIFEPQNILETIDA